MNEKLFPFQKVGREFLQTHRLALLADEMGLGKSVQAILAADSLRAQRILIVCPAVARRNWLNELRRWSHFSRRYFVVESADQVPRRFHSPIYSYDLLMRHHVDGLLDLNFDVCILDEAHFLKSPYAKRTQIVLGGQGAIRGSKRIWALTGTPMPNNAGELWPLMRTFGVTKLRYPQFIERYCTTRAGFREFREVTGNNPARVPELRALLALVMLRRTKKEVLPDLPPLLIRPLVVQRGKVKWNTALIHEMRDQLARVEMELEDDFLLSPAELINVLEGLSRSVSTLRRYLGLQKVAPAIELARELLEANNREKMGLFCVHTEVADQLLQGLNAFNPVKITGSTPAGARDLAVTQFQNDPGCRIFIGNVQAAGTSITLTAGHRVVMVEQEWTPSHNDQAMQRFHRIGQKFPVTVDVLEIEDSLDQKINGILRRKSKDIAEIFL